MPSSPSPPITTTRCSALRPVSRPVAVIVASPGATPVSVPLALTLATSSSELAQL